MRHRPSRLPRRAWRSLMRQPGPARWLCFRIIRRSPISTQPICSGAQVVSCDAARALAVETLIAERRLVDEWLKLDERGRQGWLSRFAPR